MITDRHQDFFFFRILHQTLLGHFLSQSLARVYMARSSLVQVSINSGPLMRWSNVGRSAFQSHMAGYPQFWRLVSLVVSSPPSCLRAMRGMFGRCNLLPQLDIKMTLEYIDGDRMGYWPHDQLIWTSNNSPLLFCIAHLTYLFWMFIFSPLPY